MIYEQKEVDFNLFMKENEFDEDTTKQLYKFALAEITREKGKAVSNLENFDYEGLKKTVHKIKGITSSYKIFCVLGIINALEVELKEEK